MTSNPSGRYPSLSLPEQNHAAVNIDVCSRSENRRFFPNKKAKKKTPFGFPRFQGEEGGKENAFANNDPPKHPKKNNNRGDKRE